MFHERLLKNGKKVTTLPDPAPTGKSPLFSQPHPVDLYAKGWKNKRLLVGTAKHTKKDYPVSISGAFRVNKPMRYKI